MNPFLMGMATLAAANNPQLAAQIFGQNGIAPPMNSGVPAMSPMEFALATARGGSPGIGSYLEGPLQPTQAMPETVMPGMSVMGAPVAQPSGQAFAGNGMPMPAGTPGTTQVNPLTQMQRLPENDRPITNVGVNGPGIIPGRPGEANASLKDMFAMLTQMRRQDPLTVPTLGSLLG